MLYIALFQHKQWRHIHAYVHALTHTERVLSAIAEFLEKKLTKAYMLNETGTADLPV